MEDTEHKGPQGPYADKRVAILYGGESEEREISLKTGRAFHFALLSLGYQHVELIDATSVGLRQLAVNPPDVALLALHGGLGENGAVQGLLECLKVPYTGSGVAACGIAMDKITTKRLWRAEGLPTPDWMVMSRAEVEAELASHELEARVPCVIKPVSSGSSVGVTLVREAGAYYGALEAALEAPGRIMVEALIEGRELTVGLMDGQVMGVIEIAPERGFYDYTAKYADPTTRYIFPAPLAERVHRQLCEAAERAFKVVGCRGVARLDVMMDAEDQFFFLEINTTPGMTETSLVPKIAAGSGISFERFTEMLLNRARLDEDAAYG